MYYLPVPATGFFTGQKTVTTAGTAVQLTTSRSSNQAGLVIKALEDNTGKIYVGDSDVDSTNGFELGAGDDMVMLLEDNSTIYIDASVNGEGVSFIGFTS